MQRLIAPLAVSAAIVGCAGGSDASPQLVVQIDSSDGVVRVRHIGPTAMSELVPVATIGRLGSAAAGPSLDEFGRVESVIADSAGAIYVADGLAREIRVFGPDGRFLRSLGRKGSGPGEMAGVHGIAWLTGDTMVVMRPTVLPDLTVLTVLRHSRLSVPSHRFETTHPGFPPSRE